MPQNNMYIIFYFILFIFLCIIVDSYLTRLYISLDSCEHMKNINKIIKPKYFIKKYIFFDIFYKDDNIYIILPIYNKPINIDDIKLKINNIDLILKDKYIKDDDEPIMICIYEYLSNDNNIELTVQNDRMIQKYRLPHIRSTKKYNLTLTTLFKNDYICFPIFYDYYKKQGVEHFYMYYNGITNDEIKNVFNKNDVTLIEWNYHYYNNSNYKYIHHAQPGQIHHAIYRYGKNSSEYMIFCDLDEYMHIPNFTLSNYVMKNKDIDVFGFCNRWSDTLDSKIPEIFPNKFKSSNKLVYMERSKNIFKIEAIQTIDIHRGNKFNYQPKIITDLDLYHFYKWSGIDRNIDTPLLMNI